MGLFKRNTSSAQILTSNPVQGAKGYFAEFIAKTKTDSNPQNKNLADMAVDFKSLWGTDLPGELLDILRILSDNNFPAFGRWESSPLRTDILSEKENIVEKVLLKAQVEFPTDHFVEWFSGSVSLDPIVNVQSGRYHNSNSYSYQYPIYEALLTGKSSPQIYIYNHNRPDSWGTSFEVMARDTPSFLYTIMLMHSMFRTKEMSNGQFSTCMDKVKTHVRLPYTYFNSTRVGNRWISTYDFRYSPPTQRGSTLTLDYYERSRWILELLRGNHNDYLWYAQNSFYKNYLNPKLDDARHAQNLEHLPHHVPDALYYLFRCFFRKEKRQLREYIDVCKGSSSRIIKDAAELVEQFEDGRTFFGEISDMQALRDNMNKGMRW